MLFTVRQLKLLIIFIIVVLVVHVEKSFWGGWRGPYDTRVDQSVANRVLNRFLYNGARFKLYGSTYVIVLHK